MANFGPLSEVIDTAVNVSLRTANLECRGEEEEPDKVLSFFIYGLELIENEFNRLLQGRGIRVSISGIFTHQTPMVDLASLPAGKRRCELADLFVLATYGQQLAPYGGLGNALFLQAKNDFDHGADPIQRKLYEVEPGFEYGRPQAIRNEAPLPPTRTLPPKGDPALAYWELDGPRWWMTPNPNQWPTGLLWANQVNRQIPQRHPFGAAIVDFLRGAAGHGFRAPVANSKGWSRIVFDLLNVTARGAVNRRNMNVRGAARGIGTLTREIFQNMRGSEQPFAVRNSLADTLAFYSEELGELGKRIEAAEKFPSEEKLKGRNGDDGDEGKGDGGAPPILGNRREFEEENGGAGNLILIRFYPRE